MALVARIAEGNILMDAKSIIIVLLAVAVAVLGYLYYEHSRHGIVIDTPAVKIEAK